MAFRPIDKVFNRGCQIPSSAALFGVKLVGLPLQCRVVGGFATLFVDINLDIAMLGGTAVFLFKSPDVLKYLVVTFGAALLG